MEFKYQLTPKDYRKFLKETLKKRYILLLTFYFLLCIFLIFLIYIDGSKILSDYSFPISFSLVLFLLFVTYDILLIIKSHQIIKNNPIYLSEQTVKLKKEGIEINSKENILLNWNKINKTKTYLAIILKDKTAIILKTKPQLF